jgi:signal transduction histidine kinase
LRDSAGGISDELIDKIFDPYFTTKHQSRGTGIGLYMTNQIITKHFLGSITAKNVEFTYDEQSLKGIEFTIKISC